MDLNSDATLPTRKKFSVEKSKARLGVLFVSPAIAIIGFIILYPLLNTLVSGFYNENMMRPDAEVRFVGLANYIYLFQLPLFWRILSNNILITVLSVFFQVVIAMIVALLLNITFAGRGIVRGLNMLPWITPTYISAFIFVLLLNPSFGIINQLLMRLGILDVGFPWLGNTSTVIWAVVVANTWKGMPWVIIVFLSGLQMVSTDHQEAARVDGASKSQEFWRITLPAMKDIVIIAVLLRTIWTFNWFDYIWLMTAGGPLDRTMTIPIQIYKYAFETYHVGRASALGGVLFAFLVLFTVVYFRVLNRKEHV